MPYNFVADSFHTKKLCSRLSSSDVRFYTKNRRYYGFEPPFGGIEATYDDDHWKAHSGLPISVNLTFFAGCYG